MVTARNASESTIDTLSFEVYNPNGINIFASNTQLDNNPTISSMSSEQILALNRQIELTSTVRVAGGEEWHVMESMGWSSDSNETVSVNSRIGSLWYDISTSYASSFHPATGLMAIGLNEGAATITTTHYRTGLTTSVDIDVATLKNKLYLSRVSPAITTDLIYENGKGETVNLRSNSNGEIAIYEPEGIAGEVRFTATSGSELYLGSIDSSHIQSGEQNPGMLQLYPMNNVRLRLVTDQIFYPYLPNGQAYTGRVAVTGGLYKNGAFLPESKIIYPSITATGGKFTITMDSSKFGDLNYSDNLQFGFEVVFLDGNYAPRLLLVDGYTSNIDNITMGDAIMHLKPWNGNGFEVVQYIYQDDEAFDVTN